MADDEFQEKLAPGIRAKLFGSYSTIIVLSILLCSLFIYSLMHTTVETNIKRELQNSTAAMAKFLGGETAVFCANAAVELHGGYGYIDEYNVQKWYRDAKILELYEGTKEAEIMTIGRVLLSK